MSSLSIPFDVDDNVNQQQRSHLFDPLTIVVPSYYSTTAPSSSSTVTAATSSSSSTNECGICGPDAFSLSSPTTTGASTLSPSSAFAAHRHQRTANINKRQHSSSTSSFSSHLNSTIIDHFWIQCDQCELWFHGR